MVAKSISRPEQLFLFARNFFKHPRMLGSLIPSSRFLIGQVLRQIDWDRARVLIEYGPGVGTFTTEILKRMSPDAALVVFETNADFVEYLRLAIPDPRLHVVHGSAAEVNLALQKLGHEHADYVISGIPFSTIPEAVCDRIVRATHSVLQPEGAFLVYQFSCRVLPYLERVFGHVQQDFEPLNILPARLFYCLR
jgi:phospholipid N-methyltransferase